MDKDILRRNAHADPPGRHDPLEESNIEEPEREVRAKGKLDDAKVRQYEIELQNRWEAIMALRDLVMKQRAVIHSLKSEREDTERNIPLDEIREEAVSKASTLSGSVSTDYSEFAKKPKRTSRHSECEDDISAITCEGEGSSIDSSDFLKMEHEMQIVLEGAKAQAVSPANTMISFEKPDTSVKIPTKPAPKGGLKGAIASIQEQASHVDAAIALDQLQTTKNELESVTSELHKRTAELGKLKNQVRVLECQIATLELERDLHMAEATRAREDLKDCFQYLVKLKTKDDEESSRRSSIATEPLSSASQNKGLEAKAFATPEKASVGMISIGPNHSVSNNDNRPQQATPSTQVSEATAKSRRFDDDHSISSFSSDGHPRRNLALCFWTQRSKETLDDGPAFERMDDLEEARRAPLFRRRKKTHRKDKDKSSKRKGSQSKASERANALKLNQRFAQADREADELRTRLHSITKYYDNIVISLQQNAASNNTEYEADMINQLSFLDREKRAVMNELRDKDTLIAKYQREITQLVGQSINSIPEQLV